MPSQRPVIMIRTDKDTIEKFKIICDEENRSMSNYAEYFIKQCIKKYESEHGELTIEE